MSEILSSLLKLKNIYILLLFMLKYHLYDLFQSFFITDLGSPGDKPTSLSDIKSLQEVLLLMWDQTYPLFVKPHLSNMLLMMFLIFNLFFIAHGFYVW